MSTEPTKQELEKLIEAQARGEMIEGVPTETDAPQNAELDRRVSKDGDDGGPADSLPPPPPHP